MKNIKDFYNFNKINEKWGDTHQAPSPEIKPDVYAVDDYYYYTSDEHTDRQYRPDKNPTFKIIMIENGVVKGVSEDGKYIDNPSTLEFNSLVKSGEIKLIQKYY